MQRFRSRIATLGTALVLAVVFSGPVEGAWNPGLPQNMVLPATARHVKLTIKLLPGVIHPGSAVLVSAVFANSGNRLFFFPGLQVRTAFSAIRVVSLATGRPAMPTKCMRHTPAMWNVNGLMAIFLKPGHSKAFWTKINFARYFDMTRPGKYRVWLVAGRILSNRLTVTVEPFGKVVAAPAVLMSAVGGKIKWPQNHAAV